MNARIYSSRNVIAGYLSVYTLFTLASSVIWAINTIFLMREGGLTIFQVMIVNTAFTVAQMVFEVPTGRDGRHHRAEGLAASRHGDAGRFDPDVRANAGLGMGYLGLHRSQRDPGVGLHVRDRGAGGLAGRRTRRHRLGAAERAGVRLGSDGGRRRHAGGFAAGRSTGPDRVERALRRPDGAARARGRD